MSDMSESLLPDEKECSDCVHFKARCKWLISAKPNSRYCDWYPIKFRDIQYAEQEQMK